MIMSDTHLRTHEPQTLDEEVMYKATSDTHLRTHEPQTFNRAL